MDKSGISSDKGIYTDRLTDRQTDRQTETNKRDILASNPTVHIDKGIHTDRQTDRQTDKRDILASNPTVHAYQPNPHKMKLGCGIVCESFIFYFCSPVHISHRARDPMKRFQSEPELGLQISARLAESLAILAPVLAGEQVRSAEAPVEDEPTVGVAQAEHFSTVERTGRGKGAKVARL